MVELERRFPLAVAALREVLTCAEESAKDARAHGGGKGALCASAHLREIWEVLLEPAREVM